jgi:GNAT superfamily N-acetyltransferase
MSAVCRAHYSTFARIHHASRSEVPDIRRFAASLGQPEVKFDWPAACSDPDVEVILAFEGSILTGVVVAAVNAAQRTAQLLWIGVSPSARRRGIGRLLLDCCADAARARGAECISAATAATEPSVAALMLAMGGHWRGGDLVIPTDLRSAVRAPLPSLVQTRGGSL